MLSHGFGIGLSTRVGHLLAERKVRSAKLVAAGGLSAGLLTLCAATAGVATDAARDAWLATFTPAGNATADAIDVAAEDELVAGVRRDTELIWPSVMAFLIVDGIYALNLGLMRGLGLQLSAALATILSLWVCGLPAIFVVGRREAEEGAVAVRRLGSTDQEVLALADAVGKLSSEAESPAAKHAV